MASENRKGARRYVVSLGARIAAADSSVMQNCKMVDVSVTGARLICAEVDKVPDGFKLVLSHDGRLVRDCKVVWRSKDTIGVEFMRRASKAENPD